ncbi:MAG: hypothetical protein Kow0068_07780 [Marinilabiliales bacterium]
MKLIYLLLVLIFTLTILSGQSKLNSQKPGSYNIKNIENEITRKADSVLLHQYNKVKQFFKSAYNDYPEVPAGVLEAVSYHYTHFRHISYNTPESCTGMPRVYGVMGLTLDGKNYFRDNLKTVSKLSGYSIDDIINNPEINIKAYAAAFTELKHQMNIKSGNPEKCLDILVALSELNIDSESAVSDFTINLYLYGILSFLNNPEYQAWFSLPAYKIDLKAVFNDNFELLKSDKIFIDNGIVYDNYGQIYKSTGIKTPCPDYNFPNCSWVESPNHYTGWNGHVVSAIAIHTVQGSYTGCISWFQNSSANASTHYVVASNSAYAGQVTQMVDESNAAWHIGSENYYAIGYEHEGYIDDPSWYTVTMYQTSADLTRDVCTDNNINPLRMFYRDTLDDGTVLDYGIHSLGAEGSCIKIKGHQHFPNQTHTDPGPYWYWDYYFRLVNNNPAVTTYTSTTGNFYDSGGQSSNYSDDERIVWTIQPPGATSVSLTFTSFNLEADYDFMYIYDGPDVWSPLIGRYNTQSPGAVTSSGGALTIEFRSDCATNASGWEASWTSTGALPANLTSTVNVCPDNNVTLSWQNSDAGWHVLIDEDINFTNPYYKDVSNLTSTDAPAGFVLQSNGTTPLVLYDSTTYYWKIWNNSSYTNVEEFTTFHCDDIAPVTNISSPNVWKTADFIADFNDSDNVAIEKAFYQVLDFDGQYWSANYNNGFFGDNFDTLQPFWTSSIGVWTVNNGELIQSDETETNTNIYAPLNQTLSNRYLYNFYAKVEGSGTNRRFGFHLFCDDASQTNRGNSYFVWFRVEGQTLEFYKVVNNSFTGPQKTVSGITTVPGQFYDFKITYDRILGIISVWRDNIFLGSWTDPNPLNTNGNYISFRSGNSKMTVTELKVYRSRYPSLTVTLGDSLKDIRYQNPNPYTSSAKIKSIVVDSARNLSPIAYHDLMVDWSEPDSILSVSDGLGADIDTNWTLTEISANWSPSNDINSGIVAYWYSVGSFPGGTNIVNWTNNDTLTHMTHNGLNLIDHQIYYVNIRAENGAGLYSPVSVSNGQVAALPVNISQYDVDNDFIVYPNPTTGIIYLNTENFNGTFRVYIYGNDGKNLDLKPVSNNKNIYTYNLKNTLKAKGHYIIIIESSNNKIKIPVILM